MSRKLMDQAGEIRGAGGGKQEKAHTPVEAPNTLQAFVRGRILDLIGYGPIKGLVNGLKSVYLDSTPVQNADDTFNFEGVTLEFRNGTPDQDVIPGFRAVENSREINTAVLFDNAPVRAVENNDADSVAITVQLAGLAKQEENGDVIQASVEVLIDLSIAGGAWQNVAANTITGKTTSAYPRTFLIRLPETGPYNIRVRRGNKESESDKLRDGVTWTLLTEIIDQPFSYPNMAMAGISVNSQLFGSSLPSRSYDVYLSVVKVPSNYNPETRTYTGLWDGTFKEAWTDNPAWAYYDLATHPIIGAGIKDVDKWELYRIGQYCDEMVPDGYGGMEPRFSINTIFSEQDDAYAALSTLASIFRGMTYWGTNTVVPVADMPTVPSRLVSPANVIDGDFHYVGTADRERHSVCVVMYNDPDNEGKSTPEVYEDPDAIAEWGWRETRVTAVGCSSRGQARRLGKWILYSERMETQTLTYRATMDHATVRPGEVIEVNDPDFQGARMAGRVITPSRTVLMLDAIDHTVINSVGGTWYLSVVMPDQRIEKAVISSFSGNQVTLIGALPEAPIAGAIWALSSAGLQLPQYRVVGVKEEEDSVYSITATEYNPDKYAFVEYDLKLPDRPISTLPSGPVTPPSDLTFQVYKYQAGGTEHQGVIISWKPSPDVRVDSYVLDAQGPADGAYRTVYNGAGISFDLTDAHGGQWLFRVRSVAKGIPSQWLMRTVQLQMLLLPSPPDSVDLKIGTLEITLTPVSAYPDTIWEFWRSTTPLQLEQIEGSATYVASGTYLVDTGLKPDTQYYYFIRGVNQYGKSTWYAVQAKTENNFDDIIDAVIKDAQEGPLGQWFQGKLDETLQDAIDNANQQVSDAIQYTNDKVTETRTYAEELATSTRNYADGLASQAVDWISQVNNRVTDLNGVVTGINTQVTEINSQVGQLRTDLDNNVSVINGQIIDLQGQITAISSAGVYDKNTAYVENDVVRQGKRIYRAIGNVPAKADGTNAPPNATYWKDIGQSIKTADATATAVSDMQTTITNLNGTLTTHAVLLQGLRTDVDSKASSSALTSLTGRVTTAENTITSQGQAITAVNNALTQTNTNVGALQTSFTSLDGSVTALNGTVSSIGQAVTSIGTTLGNMGGNGTNLLPQEYTAFNATLPTISYDKTVQTLTAEADSGALSGYLLKADVTTSATGWLRLGTSDTDWTFRLKPSKKYIFSCWVKGSAAHNSSVTIRYRTSGAPAEFTAGNVPVTTTLTRVSIVFTTPAALIDDALIVIRSQAVAAVGTTWFDGFMLEDQIGNGVLPSAFTPGYATRQTTAMAAATTALSGRVSSAEGTITSLSQSVTSLNNSLTLIGSENLVFNPSFEKAGATTGLGEGWTFDKSAGVGHTLSQPTSSLDANGVCQRIDLTGLSAALWFRLSVAVPQRIKVTQGVTYTASMYLRATAGLQIKPQINGVTSAGAVTLTWQPALVPATGAWQRLTFTFTPSATTDLVYLSAVVYGTASLSAGYLEVDRVQLEEGGIATGWRDNGQVIARDVQANSTALTSLTSTVTQIGNTVTSQSQSITQLSNSLSNAGGENMFFNPSFDRGTATLAERWRVGNSGTTYTGSLVPSTLDSSGKAQRFDVSVLTAGTGANFLDFAPAVADRPPVRVGQTYTASVYLRGTVGLQAQVFLQFKDAASGSLQTFLASLDMADGWQRISVTGVAPATAVATDVLYRVRSAPGSSLTAGFVEWDRAQLELSDVVTGWRDNTKALAADAAANATVVQALSSKVLEHDGTLTSQGQSITSLNNSLSVIGASGVNLIPAEYSVFGPELPPMYLNGGIAVAAVADPATFKGYALQATTSSTATGSIVLLAPSITAASVNCNMSFKNQKYIMSFWAKANVAGHQVGAYARVLSADGTSFSTGPVTPVTLTTSWARYSVVMDLTSATYSGSQCQMALQVNRSGVSGRVVQYDRIMFEPVVNNATEPSAYVIGNSYDQVTAVSGALSTLGSTVSSINGTVTSQGNSITSLTNTINHPTTGLATKASAAALTALTNTVTQQGDAITSASQNLTSLNNVLSRTGNNSPTKVYQSVFSGMSMDQWVSTNSGNTAGAAFSNVAGNTSGATLTLTGGTNNRTWWGASTRRIRFNPDVLYKLTVRAQQVAVALADPKFYAGLDAYAEDGVTRINVTGGNTVGSSHYPVAQAVSLPVGQWTTYTAYVKGHTIGSEGGSSGAGTIADPKRMKTGTAWISPVLLAGHDSKGGEVAVDYYLIEDVTEQVQIDATASAVSGLTSTVTQQGQSITSLSQNIVTLTNTLGEVGGENLFYNPTFNKGDTSLPDGWQKEGAADAVNSVVTSWLNTGERAYRAAVTGVTSVSPYHSLRNINAANTAARVTPGAVHTASVYARRMATSAALQLRVWIQYLNEAGASVASTASNPSTIEVAGGRFSHTSTAPADAVMAFVYFRVHGPTAAAANGTIELARPQFEQAGQVSGWKDNGRVTASEVAAVSTAVDALTSTVSNQGGTITSQGSRLTSLENSVNNATTGLNSKASASSVTALTNRVTAAEGTLTSQSSDITQLKNSLSYAQPFVAGKSWEFTGSTQGWQAMDAAASFVAGPLFGTMYKPSNFQCSFTPSFPGAENPYLRVRLRRRNTSRAGARIYWANEDGGLAEARRVDWTISVTTTDWQDIEIDLSGHTGWNGKNIIAMRLDMTSSGDTTAEIDVAYISVGRRASAASAQALSSLTSEVSDTKTLVTSQGSRITSLENSVNSSSTGLATKASASALTALTNRVTAAEGSITSQSGSITSLQNDLAAVQVALGSSGLDPAANAIWQFDSSVEGWTGEGCTISAAGGVMTVTATSNDPRIVRGSLAVQGSTYTLVRAKITRKAGAASDWDGKLFYSTSGHGQSGSYYKQASNPALAIGQTAVVEWDMAALTAGGNDWISNTITQIRLDIGGTTGGSFDVDWVAVGRIGPGASSQALDSLTSTVSQQDGTITSQGTRLTSLENSVNNATTGLASKASASALTSLTNRVTAAEGTITSQSSAITALENSVNSTSSGLNTKASTTSLNALTTRVSNTETSITAQSTLITNLRADLNSTQGVNLLPDSYTWLTNIDPPFTLSGFSSYGTTPLAAAPSGYALQFTATSGSASNIVLRAGTTDNMTLSAGTYIFSLYARVTNKTTNSLMPFLSGQATINGTTLTVNGTRTKYTMTFTVTTEGRYSLGFQTSGNAGATIQADSLMFERQTGNSTAASAFMSGQSTVRVAQVEGNVTAAATNITSLTTRMGNNEATVTQLSSSMGGMRAMWGIKVALSSNGKQYIAGIGVNVTNNNGVTQGEILLQAERLTLLNVATGGMFAPFVITDNIVYIANAMIQNGSIATAKIADAAITSAKIGVAEVDTLRIRGNAVTVPTSVTSPGKVTGGGVNVWKNLVAVGVLMEEAGYIMCQYGCYQGFGSGIRRYQFEMNINGIVIAQGGGDWADGFPNLLGSIAVGPGYHIITVKWWGEDANVGVSGHTLYAMGTKR